jgi:hypothetical protein
MSLAPAGTNPIVKVIFETTDPDIFMSCDLFLKNKVPGSNWIQIFSRFNNKGLKTHSFIIDPTTPPISGHSLTDLIGCQIGWVVSVFDLAKPISMKFSFHLDIQQSGTSIMPSPIKTTESSANVTINTIGDQAIFNEKFTL